MRRSLPRARRPVDSPPRTPAVQPWLVAAVAVVLGLPWDAPDLAGQAGRTTLSVWSGLPLPAEDLANWVDGGFDLGASVERRISDRWGVVLVGGRSYLDPSPKSELGLGHEPGPPVVQWRYTLGLLFELTEPERPWEVSFNGGMGAITYDVKREEATPGYFETAGAAPIRDADVNTGPALTAQLRVGRDLDEYLGVPLQMFFQSQWNFVFNDAGDPSEFLGRDSLFTNGFGLAWSF